jgi:glycosyltransferase involved in cell wall biosynthesis
MKILFMCERLGERDDEGIRNLAQALLDHFAERHDVLALTQGSNGSAANVLGISMSPLARRTFLSADLLRQASRFDPDVTLYVPWTSGTLPTFVRARVLRHATRGPVAIYLTQPYDNPRWQRIFVRRLLPELVMALSDNVVRHLAQLGAEAELVPAGVDLERFRMPTPEERARERAELDVAADEQLVVHVGHLNRSRMDEAEIAAIARRPRRRVIVVGSTSTPQDPALVHGLEVAGCRVIGRYLPRIESLYHAADAYLFPTRAQRSSIGVPLSVLEALACGVPVVSTRFEGLPRLFPAATQVRFFSSLAQLERALDELPTAPDAGARQLVGHLDWSGVATTVERHLLSLVERSQLELPSSARA